MSSLLFSKQDPVEVATRTSCSKLSNNTALVISELAREPAQGLIHVAAHVQRSIPVLLDMNQQLQMTAAQLQAVLSELQDAQEGVLSITSPSTQQDLAALAESISHAATGLQQQRQHDDHSATAAADHTVGSSRLQWMFGAQAGAAAAAAATAPAQ